MLLNATLHKPFSRVRFITILCLGIFLANCALPVKHQPLGTLQESFQGTWVITNGLGSTKPSGDGMEEPMTINGNQVTGSANYQGKAFNWHFEVLSEGGIKLDGYQWEKLRFSCVEDCNVLGKPFPTIYALFRVNTTTTPWTAHGIGNDTGEGGYPGTSELAGRDAEGELRTIEGYAVAYRVKISP